ncbi:MAG: hypothetical protein ACREPR_17520 [Brasilonema sp.]
MKSLKSSLIVLGTVGLLFLGACSNATQENNSASNTESSTAANTSKTETGKSDNSSKEQKGKDHSHQGESHEGKEHSHGGQVVESGQYHLEFVAEKEDKGSHIDFYLEKGEKHEAVPNAKVTADVQLPDGKQKTIPLKYETSGKHYTAVVSEQATGQYQVKITADIGGEKVNGRFSFNQ